MKTKMSEEILTINTGNEDSISKAEIRKTYLENHGYILLSEKQTGLQEFKLHYKFIGIKAKSLGMSKAIDSTTRRQNK